jgi:hypothetical protein
MGIDAGIASALAKIKALAKWTAVSGLVPQAPLPRLRADQPQGKPCGAAEGILISRKEPGMVKAFK